MNYTFSTRCESALLHPATIMAVLILLVNDMVLKSLWPGSWITGKLSDLAWVVFALPLLAFLLSTVTRGNRAAERAAFFAAYAGLPILAWVEKEIAQLDKEYQAALQRSAPMAHRAALYRTVPGVGPLTAAILVAHLPELGQWDGKALTSLVGPAPWSGDSGQKRGRRAIRGGCGVVRRALYVCALAVIRHDSEMRRFYRRLRERGKPGNVSVVAVMRKLLLQPQGRCPPR